jgi:hypothetical protein
VDVTGELHEAERRLEEYSGRRRAIHPHLRNHLPEDQVMLTLPERVKLLHEVWAARRAAGVES